MVWYDLGLTEIACKSCSPACPFLLRSPRWVLLTCSFNSLPRRRSVSLEAGYTTVRPQFLILFWFKNLELWNLCLLTCCCVVVLASVTAVLVVCIILPEQPWGHHDLAKRVSAANMWPKSLYAGFCFALLFPGVTSFFFSHAVEWTCLQVLVSCLLVFVEVTTTVFAGVAAMARGYRNKAPQCKHECRLHHCIFLVPFPCCIKNLGFWLFVFLIVALLVMVLVSVTAALVAVLLWLYLSAWILQLSSHFLTGVGDYPRRPITWLVVCAVLSCQQVRLHDLLNFRELCQAETNPTVFKDTVWVK